jgi:hypothetical protein
MEGSIDREQPPYTRHIYPVLKRADGISHVQGMAHANETIRPLSDAARIAGFAVAANRARVAVEADTCRLRVLLYSSVFVWDAEASTAEQIRILRTDLHIPFSDDVPADAL